MTQSLVLDDIKSNPEIGMSWIPSGTSQTGIAGEIRIEIVQSGVPRAS